jgi:hypothetical protein
MKPYDEIRTERLRTALAERKGKTCCEPCKKGKTCAGTTESAEEAATRKRSFVDRLVGALTRNS